MDRAAKLELHAGDALIVVDVQNDFLPGGSRPVPRGDEVVPPLNRCIDLFAHRGLPVLATRDWHPPDHLSFESRGGPWPPHCVAGTPGAHFAPRLRLPSSVRIISKATVPDADAYSGFDGTDLEARLRGLHVRRVFVGGLATDYAVRGTVEDALERGFAAHLLVDAVRAADVHPGDGDAATAAMQARGARLVEVDRIAP